MATYAIGDVQGCSTPLRQLVDPSSLIPRQTIVVRRRPCQSRPPLPRCLSYIKRLGPAAQIVLGNHDLFLLAVADDIVAFRPKDTIQDVWQQRTVKIYSTGFGANPSITATSFFMVHAGLLPQWTIDEAVNRAREVEAVLSGPNYRTMLEALFRGLAPRWDPALTGDERLASITRVLTRLRTCTPAGDLSGFSGPPEQAPAGYLPWFRIPNRKNADATVICGHWAALGLRIENNLLAIDSGCVWGKELTAVRLEDRQIFQVAGVRRARL